MNLTQDQECGSKIRRPRSDQTTRRYTTFYLVDTTGGCELRRNRRHLVRTNPEENGENEHSETENVQQNESFSCQTTERNDGSEMILEQRPRR